MGIGVEPDVALEAWPELAQVVPQAGQPGPVAATGRRMHCGLAGHGLQVIDEAMVRPVGKEGLHGRSVSPSSLTR
ncbi:MAG: hypothetical protein Fur0014_08450 [Rubrivivax sp.]